MKRQFFTSRRRAQTAIEYMLLLGVVVAIVLIMLKRNLYTDVTQQTANQFYNSVVVGIVGMPPRCGDGTCQIAYESCTTCSSDCHVICPQTYPPPINCDCTCQSRGGPYMEWCYDCVGAADWTSQGTCYTPVCSGDPSCSRGVTCNCEEEGKITCMAYPGYTFTATDGPPIQNFYGGTYKDSCNPLTYPSLPAPRCTATCCQDLQPGYSLCP